MRLWKTLWERNARGERHLNFHGVAAFIFSFGSPCSRWLGAYHDDLDIECYKRGYSTCFLQVSQKLLTERRGCCKLAFVLGEVAQSVEQWTENPRVRCSIHRLAIRRR